MTTAPELMWRAFGSRAPEGKTGSRYRFAPATGRCVTCGAGIAAGVPFAAIDNETFSGHAEFARWGTHACAACAWLYGDPKRTHRGMLVIGAEGWWPTIKADLDGRPRWREALLRIGKAAPQTPMTGVLTTDPKPRLWPRAQLAVCARPGVYLHIPEQDISGWVSFDLAGVRDALDAVDRALALGASKTLALRGLWGSPALADKAGLAAVAAAERALAPLRGSVEMVIAAVVA